MHNQFSGVSQSWQPVAVQLTVDKGPGRRIVEALALALEDNNPALQVRATESLRGVTGENIGRDVAAWKRFILQSNPTSSPADSTRIDEPRNSAESTADNRDGFFAR